MVSSIPLDPGGAGGADESWGINNVRIVER